RQHHRFVPFHLSVVNRRHSDRGRRRAGGNRYRCPHLLIVGSVLRGAAERVVYGQCRGSVSRPADGKGARIRSLFGSVGIRRHHGHGRVPRGRLIVVVDGDGGGVGRTHIVRCIRRNRQQDGFITLNLLVIEGHNGQRGRCCPGGNRHRFRHVTFRPAII